MGSAKTFAGLAASSLALAACSGEEAAGGPAGRAAPPGRIRRGYVSARPGRVPVEQDLPARVSAYQISEVRPQASGVVLRRYFREGGIVRQGQTLYQIDASLYQAQVNQAAANVQSARANAEAARA